ncbi:ABC transporter substrate-binding protein [Ancylobacter sp. 6x-1]|uniref:ABC transporter substrate-binding protein n=2 Tax=Ancylobacter crimeensis TaxID=2579147 RepID=A0ABT0DG63_9HYPH|nr:ABC transporter substrate-binding protein [Ancylobacter crimeensis]MCK0198957.1 ABC transporter substrate-binding protein [Ancylobacter crimeensis]
MRRYLSWVAVVREQSFAPALGSPNMPASSSCASLREIQMRPGFRALAARCARALLVCGLGAASIGAGLRVVAAEAADKVTFGTNWVAQAEHGGFYQAVVDGTYAKYGLDVKILPGGPQANNRLLLPVGKIDFYMGANMLQAFDSVKEGIPTIIVAAMFQKDPQVLIAHPDVKSFDELKSKTLFVSKEGLASYYQWLVKDYGFSESQVKPYTFNVAPFLADKNSAMQGYITSEPFAVEKEGGFKPSLFLLADQGFDTYSTTIETRSELARTNPDLVQRFVDASIIGWYNYLYGDNSKANALIKKDNPEMTDEMIAFSIAKMKDYGIVDSGDTLTSGIGAMTDARMKSFFDKMVRAKVVDGGIDYTKAYTLQFVNKGVGKELRPQ